MNAYTEKIIDNFDVKTFKASPVLEKINEKYTNLRTKSSVLSTLKHSLLKKITIDGINGKVYHDTLKKRGLDPVLVPEEIMKLKLSKTDTMSIIRDNKKVLENRQELVEFPRTVMEDILLGLDGNSFNELLPALLVATGRRTIEILKTGSLKTQKGSVFFEGQVKTGFNPQKPYKIPLLADTKNIKSALRRLRKLVNTEKMDNKQVQKKFSSSIQNVFKKLSKIYGIQLNPHKLRAVYLEECFLNKNDKQLSKNKLGMEILGHSQLETSLHYVSIKIV